MKKITPGFSARQGRPVKAASQQRVHKVTVSFTDAEYHYFKELAGHEPIAPDKLNQATARPRRRYGSIAGHIRSILQQAKAPLTPTQNGYLLQLIDACNTLDNLAHKAESGGLLAVSLSLSTLQQRMSQLLDAYDHHKPVK